LSSIAAARRRISALGSEKYVTKQELLTDNSGPYIHSKTSTPFSHFWLKLILKLQGKMVKTQTAQSKDTHSNTFQNIRVKLERVCI
jgi:hypothetical protein